MNIIEMNGKVSEAKYLMRMEEQIRWRGDVKKAKSSTKGQSRKRLKELLRKNMFLNGIGRRR